MPAQVKAFAADADMLVDSLFGTGLGGQLSGEYKQLIDSIMPVIVPFWRWIFRQGWIAIMVSHSVQLSGQAIP